jgi:small-conductance mechanosensitive channel
MQLLVETLKFISPALPVAIAILVVAGTLYAVDRFFRQRSVGRVINQFRRQLILLGLTFAGILLIIMTLPISDTLRGQLLSLIGILLSAAIAFSSTTMIGNAMAGLMLKAQKHFRAGDFVRVEEHFGRVSDRGLFYTEVQTEFRDLVTLPNMYLATHPVTVMHSPGTLVHASVSLGYDVSRTKVERLMIEAAEAAELKDGFVQILELGDFSVVYRVSGLLEDVKQLLSARSRLKAKVLDSLHEGGVEIVSPNFMNQEPLPTISPEAVMFQKAEEAASLAKLEEMYGTVEEKIKQLQEQSEDDSLKDQHEQIKASVGRFEQRRAWLADLIKARKGGADK